MHQPQPLRTITGSISQQTSLTMLSCNWTADLKTMFFVCYKVFSGISSILLATNPIWKDNVREFCNHYRQDIPNYAGLPAELLSWERMWKGKKDRREDILTV